MNSGSPKTFLPRDKPKSWIVFIVCGLMGLLIAGPVVIIGMTFHLEALRSVGIVLFWFCWAAGGVMWLVYISRLIAGKYKEIAERDWREQIW